MRHCDAARHGNKATMAAHSYHRSFNKYVKKTNIRFPKGVRSVVDVKSSSMLFLLLRNETLVVSHDTFERQHSVDVPGI